MLRRTEINQDDKRILVENEQFPESTILDNDFGGVADDDIVTDDEYLPVDLTTQQVFEIPPDRYNYTYMVFYLLGIASMTPWSFFITAEDYWMLKFRNTTINNTEPHVEPGLTPMQKSFSSDLTMTASLSGTTFLILNAIYGQHYSSKLKIVGSLSIILALFIVTTAFVEVNTDQWQEQFFLLTIFTVVIVCVCSAIMSGGIFGIAGLFPSEYMSAVVSGQALCGLLTAVALILLLTFGAPPNVTAFIYFVVGSLLILTSIVTYVLMTRQAFFNYYLEGSDKYEINEETPSHSRAVTDNEPLEPNLREVCGKIYVEITATFLHSVTTFSVYPAVTLLMQSQNYGHGIAWNDVYYMPVVNYLFFSSGDYLGRILAGKWQKPRDNCLTALLMVLMRIIYIPFFLCSNTSLHVYLPTLVKSDVAFITLILTFALTNGYLTNILLIMAPRSVQQHEIKVASSLMIAALSCGPAFGSLISMVFVQLL